MKKALVFLLLISFFWNVQAQNPNWWPFVALTRPYSPGVLWTDPQNNFLYVGGDYDSIANIEGNCISRFDGTTWWPMGAGFYGPGIHYVSCFAFYNGIIAGGYFTNSGNSTVNNLATWNGSSWIPLGGGVNGRVYDLGVFNGELYVTGDFTMAGNVPVYHFARWNGSNWNPVINNYSGYCYYMQVYNNDIYFADNNSIFKLNGGNPIAVATLSSSSGPASVTCMKVFNNELYVGGDFDLVNNQSANYIFRFDGNNCYDVGGVTFPYCIYPVNGMEVCGNDLFITGAFDTLNGNLPGNGFAIWNGNAWSTIGSGPYDGYGIRVFKGDIYASMRLGVMKYDSTLTSLNKRTEVVLGIFPNPSAQKISIRLPLNKRISAVNFYDMNGNAVRRYSTALCQYDVSEFASGIYFVEVMAEDQQRYMGKFVKQ
ncbi:MAG TPA: T9SS type A sorting domain-containing protein [Bacteroidia bacterium]|jgi:hypothetical protein